MALSLLKLVQIPMPGGDVDAVVVEGGLALIPQNTFLTMMLGQDGMKDAVQVEKWRQLTFYKHNTRVRMKSVVYLDHTGDEQLGYRVSDVVKALWEFSQWALAQPRPLRNFGECARECVARMAMAGIYMSIRETSGINVNIEGLSP